MYNLLVEHFQPEPESRRFRVKCEHFILHLTQHAFSIGFWNGLALSYTRYIQGILVWHRWSYTCQLNLNIIMIMIPGISLLWGYKLRNFLARRGVTVPDVQNRTRCTRYRVLRYPSPYIYPGRYRTRSTPDSDTSIGYRMPISWRRNSDIRVVAIQLEKQTRLGDIGSWISSGWGWYRYTDIVGPTVHQQTGNYLDYLGKKMFT